MKKFLIIGAVVISGILSTAVAQEQGVITRDRVNVRGKASVFSEVLTQLNKGDKVTIIETVKTEKPKEGDLTEWVKIQLPPNALVYVHSSFINTNLMTVIPNRLNLRAGPGEEYSVLGVLEKGTSVKVVETKGAWYQIEVPANAYAYVAAEFVEKQPTRTVKQPEQSVPVKEESKPEQPTQPTQTVKPDETAKPVSEEKKPETKPEESKPIETKPEAVKTEEKTPDKETTKEETKPEVVDLEKHPLIKQEAEAKERVLSMIQGKKTTPATPILEPEVVIPPPPPRIVAREGYVRGTLNIQAPSGYVLQTVDTGKTINYLHTTSTNILLKQYKGKRVMVIGKEAIDKRWPNTPVLTIESIREIEEEQQNAQQ
ncbi:MAG: SH3 domain-containing protein [Verrucomicrobiae bacterium]|nr:SH3 domain-containing protein [Verrucomicrobiae bacterium]